MGYQPGDTSFKGNALDAENDPALRAMRASSGRPDPFRSPPNPRDVAASVRAPSVAPTTPAPTTLDPETAAWCDAIAQGLTTKAAAPAALVSRDAWVAAEGEKAFAAELEQFGDRWAAQTAANRAMQRASRSVSPPGVEQLRIRVTGGMTSAPTVG